MNILNNFLIESKNESKNESNKSSYSFNLLHKLSQILEVRTTKLIFFSIINISCLEIKMKATSKLSTMLNNKTE